MDMPRIRIADGRFCANGRPVWFNAVNTPWHRWNDFGGRFEPDFWDEHFARLRGIGVNAARIWINCGGMVGVWLREDGMLDHVTEKHWQDLDVLFALAHKHGVYVMATLLSFDHFKEHPRGTHLAWRRMLADENAVRSFVDGYVVPFVRRYGDEPALFAIDLMNEPDWVARNPECGLCPWEQLSRLFAHEAAAIHANSEVLVTTGIGLGINNSDRLAGNKVGSVLLRSLTGDARAYMDFDSPHYYAWERRFVEYPFTAGPEAFGLDGTRPAVIGECAAVDETGVPLAERYENAWRSGWDGVFAWTSNGVDPCGGFEDVRPAAERMAALIPDQTRIVK